MSAATATTEAVADQVEDAADALLTGNPADEMPAVELQAVAAEQAREIPQETAENQQIPAPSPAPAAAPQPASKPVLVDSQGRTFDPLLHETEDGVTPQLRADGKTIKCRRVPLREFKTTSKVQVDQPGAPAVEPAAPEPTPAPVDPEKAKRMREAGARTIAGMQILVMRKALGEHIAGEESDQAALVECWQELFAHYGMGAVHPIVGLAVVTGMITFDGMKQAETRSAISRGWLRIKLAVGNLWLRMRGRRAQAVHEESEQEA
jgi:hypothetical protein